MTQKQICNTLIKSLKTIINVENHLYSVGKTDYNTAYNNVKNKRDEYLQTIQTLYATGIINKNNFLETNKLICFMEID